MLNGGYMHLWSGIENMTLAANLDLDEALMMTTIQKTVQVFVTSVVISLKFLV